MALPRPRKLAGSQKERLCEILAAAFDRRSLAKMLDFKLEKDLDDITAPGPFGDVLYELVRLAEMEDWTYRLLLAARETRPDNAELVAFVQEVGLVPVGTPSEPALEKVVTESDSLVDPVLWRLNLGKIEGQVCRVELGGPSPGYATGFLVGPDAVVTAGNIVADVVDGRRSPADVLLRFDYKRMADGVELSRGKEYRLAIAGGSWLLDYSSASASDMNGDAGAGMPTPDELNYALLRTDGAPGGEALGEKPDPNAPKRGWIPVVEQPSALLPGSPLSIVHHPQGAPLHVNFQTQAVIGLNANGTRVWYRIDTRPGSSGAPLFDAGWNLVAMHHARRADCKEGIPFHLIVQRLRARGLDRYLPVPQP